MTGLCPRDMASSSRLTTILVASILQLWFCHQQLHQSSEEYEDPTAFLDGMKA